MDKFLSGSLIPIPTKKCNRGENVNNNKENINLYRPLNSQDLNDTKKKDIYPPVKRLKSEPFTFRENRTALKDKGNCPDNYTNQNTIQQACAVTQNTGAVKKVTELPSASSLIKPKHILCRRSTRSIIENKWGCISPISANKFTPLTAILHQGIPEGRQKFTKKHTICRSYYGQHRQDIEDGYFDDFYGSDLLEDIVYIQLQMEHRYIIKLDSSNMHTPSRNAVINWIIQVQEYLGLPYQEIFTVVYLYDLVISSTKVAINMCQLVGSIIVWIVSKNDDIVNTPMAAKLLAFCKNVYTKQQFLRMEKKLLVFFDFKFNIADITVFVVFYIKKLNVDNNYLKMFFNCVLYVLECFTLNVLYSTTLPSVKAAAAVSLVVNILRVQFKIWDQLKYCHGFDHLKDLQVLQNEMLLQVQIIQDPRFAYRQPFLKYSSCKYSQASLLILKNLVAS